VNVDVGLYGKLTRLIVILIAAAGLLGLCWWYLPLIQENERARKEILRLDAQVQKEQDAARQLNASIQAISNDPRTVERLARENLGYAKPGETVVRFSPPVTNPPARR
jgi:cell division protein FtsB